MKTPRATTITTMNATTTRAFSRAAISIAGIAVAVIVLAIVTITGRTTCGRRRPAAQHRPPGRTRAAGTRLTRSDHPIVKGIPKVTRLQKIVGLVVVLLAAIVLGTGAYAAVASGAPVASPPTAAGPYYAGPVHVCISAANESVAYFEEHSTMLGNCAAGYRQAALNELSPKFTLELGGTSYTCSADTAAAETAITCPSPSPSPSPSSSSGG